MLQRAAATHLQRSLAHDRTHEWPGWYRTHPCFSHSRSHWNLQCVRETGPHDSRAHLLLFRGRVRRRYIMNRKLSALAVLLVMFGIACGSMNRVLPSEVDAKAMEADVR